MNVEIAIYGGILAVITAVITNGVTLYLGKRKASADVQGVIQTGFVQLIEAFKGQIAVLNETVERCEEKIDALQKTVNELEEFILENKLIPPTFRVGRTYEIKPRKDH